MNPRHFPVWTVAGRPRHVAACACRDCQLEAVTYEGMRDQGRATVWVDQDGIQSPLPPRLDLVNHSPGGLDWGCTGAGPAQLALALLAHALGNDVEAVRLHQEFKVVCTAGLPYAAWRLTRAQVRELAAMARANLDRLPRV